MPLPLERNYHDGFGWKVATIRTKNVFAGPLSELVGVSLPWDCEHLLLSKGATNMGNIVGECRVLPPHKKSVNVANTYVSIV